MKSKILPSIMEMIEKLGNNLIQILSHLQEKLLIVKMTFILEELKKNNDIFR